MSMLPGSPVDLMNPSSQAPQTPDQDFADFARVAKQLNSGNIDLDNRPVVQNQDGSISTVRSITVGVDNKFLLLPTVSDDGRIMTNDQAIANYKQTGKHLGVFDDEGTANVYAQNLHESQATKYAEADPNRFGAVAQALQNLPPELQDRLHDDPAGASATIDAWIRNNIQGQAVDAQALTDAYKSIYQQRPMTMPGGDSDYRQTLQAQASQHSDASNFVAGVPQGAANFGLDVMAAVAPETANKLGQRVNAAYNTDTSRTSGKAGEFVGSTVASLPAMLVPGAAAPTFAVAGVGSARREVADRRAAGQEIGGGQEALYAGTTGAIQGILAHYVGKIMNGAPGRIPLQSLINSISPELVKSIQGTDGAVIRPLIQRAFLNAGVNAGQNEIAMMAQELARSGEGIAGPNDPGLMERATAQTPQTLVTGAVQGAAFSMAHDLRNPQAFSQPPAQQLPKPSSAGEQAYPPGHEPALPEQTQPQAETGNDTPKRLPAAKPELTGITDKSDFFDDPASDGPSSPPPNEPLTDNRDEAVDDAPPEGNLLPSDNKDTEADRLAALNAELNAAIQEREKARSSRVEGESPADRRNRIARLVRKVDVTGDRVRNEEANQSELGRLPMRELMDRKATLEAEIDRAELFKLSEADVSAAATKRKLQFKHVPGDDYILDTSTGKKRPLNGWTPDELMTTLAHYDARENLGRDRDAERVAADKQHELFKVEQEIKRRLPKSLRGSMLPQEDGENKQGDTVESASEAEHPLVGKLKKLDPTARVVEPGEHAELFNDVENVTGKKVIPVKSKLAAGYADPSHPDAVAIDVSQPKKGVWNVVAHEIGHVLQHDLPDLFKQVHGRLPQWFKNQSEKTYKEMLRGHGFKDDTINQYWKRAGQEEIVSMAFGESAAASKMLQRQFRGANEGVLNSLRTTVEKVLNKFTSRGRIVNEISNALRDSLSMKEQQSTKPGSERVRSEAKAYMEKQGLSYSDVGNKPLDTNRSKRIATAYTDMKHDPENPQVKASYEALKAETKQQFEFLQDRGVTFEPWTKEGQPYKNSAEMIADVRDNKHLSFFRGGDIPADHPLAEKSGVKMGGEEMTYNDLFRAVHDYFGHAREGFQFGPRGEDNAFRAHAAMYSDEARPAMATETRGQNSYVNFGPNGEHNRTHPADTKYAEQKAGLLPDEFHAQEAPSHELSSGRLYPTIDKVRAIEEDKPLGEKAKELYNNATAKNGWKFAKAVGDTLRRGVFDSLSDFVDAARVIDKTKSITEVPLEAYIRLHAGITDRLGKMREHGVRRLFGDAYVDPTTKEVMTRTWQLDPVKQAVERLGDKPRAVKRKEAYDFTNFAMRLGVAESTIERGFRKAQKKGLQQTLQEPLTGIGNGMGLDDLRTAQDFIAKAKQEGNYDLAQEFLRRYRLMGTAHLDVLVQSGRLSRQSAAEIRKSNEFYTDLHRVMEKTGTIDPGQTAGGGVMHKFRGSNREIDNPYINQQMTTERSYQVAERNFVLKEFVQQAIAHLPNKPTLVDKEAGNTIAVYENGEKKIYKVDPMVAEAINGWGKHVTSDGIRLLGKVLGMPGRTWMFLTQKNPFYHVNNILKDMRSRAILSKESGGLKAITTEFQGLQDADTRHLVEVLGGTFGGHGEYAKTRAAYERITKRALNDLAGDPNVLLALPQKAWKGFHKFTEMSEAVGRTAEYKAQFEAAKKRGMGDQEARTYAAWKARDLMDFAVSGTWVKAINEIAYVPVLNSQFRGLAKHLEMIKREPQLYAKRMAIFGLIPSLIPAIWAHSQGEEQWKKYKGIPLVQRIMFDNYMVGNQRVVIPRGEMVASSSMMAELAFQNHMDVNDVFRALLATQVPGAVENPESLLPFRGVREARTNYSWFYNRNIIPPDEEGVALDLRKTDSASPLGKSISAMLRHAGMEVDPRKIEHVLNTDFGTLGSVVDTTSRLADDKGLPTSKRVQMIGGYERTTPGYTDQEVQRALTAADRYKDMGNPAVKVIKEALAEATKAKDVDARQKFVDKAREAADTANGFYDQYSGTLLKVKKLSMEMTAAKQEYDAASNKVQYVRDNPDKATLIRQQQTYDRVSTRINELRKILVTPSVSETTKKVAVKELKRLYDLLVKMT